MTTGTDLRYTHSSFWDFLSHHWSADWRVEPNDPHIGKLTLAHKVNLFGYKIPVGLLNIDVEAFQVSSRLYTVRVVNDESTPAMRPLPVPPAITPIESV